VLSGGGDRGDRPEDRGLPARDGDTGHLGSAIRDGADKRRQHLPAVMPRRRCWRGARASDNPAVRPRVSPRSQRSQAPHLGHNRVVAGRPVQAGVRFGTMYLPSALLRGANECLTTPLSRTRWAFARVCRHIGNGVTANAGLGLSALLPPYSSAVAARPTWPHLGPARAGGFGTAWVDRRCPRGVGPSLAGPMTHFSNPSGCLLLEPCAVWWLVRLYDDGRGVAGRIDSRPVALQYGH